MEYSFLEIVIFVGVIILLFKVISIDNSIKGIKYNLAQIANKVQVSDKPINDELRSLIKEGKDEKAVKVAKETLGMSLVEAKQYIDALKFEGK
ncbi:hypothetical protein [Alteribacter populi]|uniref:hypothetical protein n=1 Tax=Alteribacter populi TaxID=2011011 RepID=UPI000BBB128F|nr:hypothetical protein [Alteribacter populi]